MRVEQTDCVQVSENVVKKNTEVAKVKIAKSSVRSVDIVTASEYSFLKKKTDNAEIKITENIAKNLYVVIVSDTGRFMHNYTSKRTFELVTKLLKKTNLDFTSLYEPLYMRPLPEIRFQGYIYENMKITEHGVAYIKITEELLKEFGVDSASSGKK